MPGETQAEVIQKITDHSMRVMRGLENQNMDAIIGSYRTAQDNIIADLQKMFRVEQFGTPGQWTLPEMEMAGRSARLFNSINQNLRALGQQTTDIIERADVEQFKNSRARSAYALDSATPPSYSVKLPIIPDQSIRALVSEPFQGAMFSQRIGLVTDEMASNIRNQLIQSMINGESMPQAAERVADVLGASNLANPRSGANRALTIARTEVMRAQNIGRFSVYMDNDDIMAGPAEKSWRWVVTPDDRLCKWCLRREGKTPDEIEDMPAGGDPWGAKKEPPLHPHCRCTTEPILKTFREMGIDMPEDFGDEDRGVRMPDGKWKVMPKETFDKWAAQRAGELGITL